MALSTDEVKRGSIIKAKAMQTDAAYMRLALEQATNAARRGEVPVGAVLVRRQDGAVAAQAGNETVARHDPTAHAEILVIRQVCSDIGAQRIPDYDLDVTLEPSAMCAAAIAFARIPRLVFAATDPKGGGVLHGGRFFSQPTCHHKISIEDGLLANESAALLRKFFRSRR